MWSQKRVKLIAFLCLYLLPIAANAIDPDVIADACSSPEECFSRAFEVIDRGRSPGAYPSFEEQAVIKRLLELGEEGMAQIMKMLEELDPHVARLGAVALREAEVIDPSYLPQIAKALKRDVAWLAPALAAIGTADAAEIAVRKYLSSSSSPHNQELFALERLGSIAFPAILRAARCEFGCQRDTHYLLGYALGEMEQTRAEIASPLMAVAEDNFIPEAIRRGALLMIAFLGSEGLQIELDLIDLKVREEGLRYWIDEALIGIGSDTSGAIFAERLLGEFDLLLLRDIAEAGRVAVDAGSVVLDLTFSPDSEARLLAVRTLGFIQYEDAVHRLIVLMSDPSDVLLARVSSESLGRIGSDQALPDLLFVAQNHWHPSVRRSAERAVDHVRSGNQYQVNGGKKNFAFEYFDFYHLGEKPCEKVDIDRLDEDKERKLYSSYAREKLDELSYRAVRIAYGARDEESQREKDPDGIIEVNEENVIEIREEFEQAPDLALRINNGWLAASNRGEWGGELVFHPDSGPAALVLEDNIEDVYEFGERYIAVAGLAHLTMNSGLIYELSQDAVGKWKAKEWLRLPGAPDSSWLVDTGELLINTIGGGSVLLSEHGAFRMASCK